MRAEKGGRSEHELSHDRKESEMLLPARDPQQRVDGDLEHRHADADREQRQQRDAKGREGGKQERPAEGEHEGRHQDRLFAEPVEHMSVILTRAEERARSGSGSVVLESLGYGLEQQACDPFFVTLKPRASSGQQMMIHGGHELVYCLRGELDYEVAGENYRLEEGDALLFHADLPHRWRNPNSKPAIFLLIMQVAEDVHESVDQHLHP